jgi:hypothetical protein
MTLVAYPPVDDPAVSPDPMGEARDRGPRGDGRRDGSKARRPRKRRDRPVTPPRKRMQRQGKSDRRVIEGPANGGIDAAA